MPVGMFHKVYIKKTTSVWDERPRYTVFVANNKIAVKIRVFTTYQSAKRKLLQYREFANNLGSFQASFDENQMIRLNGI